MAPGGRPAQYYRGAAVYPAGGSPLQQYCGNNAAGSPGYHYQYSGHQSNGGGGYRTGANMQVSTTVLQFKSIQIHVGWHNSILKETWSLISIYCRAQISMATLEATLDTMTRARLEGGSQGQEDITPTLATASNQASARPGLGTQVTPETPSPPPATTTPPASQQPRLRGAHQYRHGPI